MNIAVCFFYFVWELKLLGDDSLPLYDLCRYRDVWVKVTDSRAWMVYLQKAKTSGVRPDYSVFAQQYSAAASSDVYVTSSSSVVENEARRRQLREGLPMYSNLRYSVSVTDDVAASSAATSCDDNTREMDNR